MKTSVQEKVEAILNSVPEDKGKGKKKESESLKILNSDFVKNSEFYNSQNQVYLKTPDGKTLRLNERSGAGLRWLKSQFYKAFKKPPNTNALTEAVGLLIAITFEKKETPVYLRKATINGDIYIDLANQYNEVLKISKDGVKVCKAPIDLLFQTVEGLTAPLTKPDLEAEPVEIFNAFHRLLGLPAKDSFKIFAWMIQAWMPPAPYFILFFTGSPGMGKSSATGFTRKIIDPLGSDGAKFASSPRNIQDFAAVLNNCFVPAFDNLSHISRELSDALAGMATGQALLGRMYYTNADIHIIEAMKPGIVNGLSPTGLQPDMKDRALHVSFAHRENFISAREWWANANDLLPAIVGVLAKSVMYALKNLHNTPLESKFRMADAVRFISAAEPFLTQAGSPWEGLNFAEILAETRQNDADEILRSHPVISILLNILETGGIIEGSASEILEQIEKRAEFDGTLNELKKDKRFPKNASALARRFTTYEPLLRDAGITHQEKRTGQKRIHSFYYTPTPEGNETDEIPV
jgi:hypothetical protein